MSIPVDLIIAAIELTSKLIDALSSSDSKPEPTDAERLEAAFASLGDKAMLLKLNATADRAAAEGRRPLPFDESEEIKP